MAKDEPKGEAPVIIKKYANRRLYNTATSSYVTLDHLCRMVKEGAEFVVYDARSGEDITRQVLTQIIVEEEGKGQKLLPLAFLRQLIRLYDDSLQAFLPRYLEVSMDNFARHREEMRAYMTKAFGGLLPLQPLEEMGQQNMAMIQRALNLFMPGAGSGNGADASEAPAQPEPQAKPAGDEIEALKAQIDAMQRELERLARKDRA